MKKIAKKNVSLLTDLKACSIKKDVDWGRRIHATAVQTGNASNLYVVTALIKMYAKCGSMVDARRMFESIEQPDVPSWNALIMGYAVDGDGASGLDMFSRMKSRGCVPDSGTYVAALKSCTSLSAKRDCLERGKEIHLEIGNHLNLFVQNMLIGMYGKSGSTVDARAVFDSIQEPDVVSWNALILGYAENGEPLVALSLFSKMKSVGYVPDHVTYMAALKACTSLASTEKGLDMGRAIHLEIGPRSNDSVKNTLIDMYAKCGCMKEAHRVFDDVGKPTTVSWNALILGYADNGEGFRALELFSRMKGVGCVPDSVTYIAALKACLAIKGDARDFLERARALHAEIGPHMNHYVRNTLIDVYSNCGFMDEARREFDKISRPNVVSWNALLMGYAENGEGRLALELFSRMKARGCHPDSVTYVAALKACTSMSLQGDRNCLECGKNIHLEIGSHLNNQYVQNTLIDMYANCGSMVDARLVFDGMDTLSVVSWSALLLGYAESGEGHVALALFSKMKALGYTPNYVTHIAVLKACGSTGALTLARKLHSEMRDFTVRVVASLVHCYAKCGSMVEAREVFDQHPSARHVPTWNALLAGYSGFGETDNALNLFEAMKNAGYRPDAITLVCVLLCCSHSGLVENARQYLEAMPLQYGVVPNIMHYNCMVDVLGRANKLNEAFAVLRKVPCNPDAVTWSTLLGACRKWKKLEMGRMAFQCFVNMDKNDSSGHVLMAHLYGSKGTWLEQLDGTPTKFDK